MFLEVPLIKSYLKNDSSEFGKYIHNENELWLKKLTSYRNLIVHSAPLVMSKQNLYAIFKTIKFTDDISLPIIHCPLPEQPFEIKKERDKKLIFKDFKKRFDSFVGTINDTSKLDCLIYAKETINNLALLSHKVSLLSPIEGKQKVVTSNDIIGTIKFN